ncbi:MAG: methyltransferase domain-containing protein [Candidatus Latescibacteria bacterium]|nr:methyltransferase domain-containing protein [Candidatus Latescibacterota bacterium]
MEHGSQGDGRGPGTLLLTTNPGLEEFVAEEFAERAEIFALEGLVTTPRPWDLDGYVQVAWERGPEESLELIEGMRSIHWGLRGGQCIELDEADPLESIRQGLRQSPIELLPPDKSFRVTSERQGTHPFTSTQAQGAAGAALVGRYGNPVDLTGYDIDVRADVYDGQCVVGRVLNRRRLSQRYQRVRQPRTALMPTVAYAMLRLAGVEEGALLDPCCGSGTILFEAAHLYPGLQLFGSDLHERVVGGARNNIATLLGDRSVELRQADVRQLQTAYEGQTFQALVSNPPYGVRQGRQVNFFHFYRAFLSQAQPLLEAGSPVVLLVCKEHVFEEVLRQLGTFRLVDKRLLKTGDVRPRIYLLERL